MTRRVLPVPFNKIAPMALSKTTRIVSLQPQTQASHCVTRVASPHQNTSVPIQNQNTVHSSSVLAICPAWHSAGLSLHGWYTFLSLREWGALWKGKVLLSFPYIPPHLSLSVRIMPYKQQACNSFKINIIWGEGPAQWQSTCSACIRSWVQLPLNNK